MPRRRYVLLWAVLVACGARSGLDPDRRDVNPAADAAAVDAAATDAIVTENDGAVLSRGCFQAVDAAGTFACALRSDGALFCWGNTIFLRLADEHVVVPTRVDSPGPVLDFSLGGAFACLTTDAGVHCFGQDNFSQLGTTGGVPHVPTLLDGLPAQVAAVSAGGSHACALLLDGSLSCWGNNGWGEVGVESSADVDPRPIVALPTRVALTDVTAIAAGEVHTCAVTGGHALYCWGGRATEPSYPSPGPSAPVLIAELPHGARAMAAGNEFTCAIGDDDVVRCWGKNGYATLGDGTQIHHATPEPILEVGVERAIWGRFTNVEML